MIGHKTAWPQHLEEIGTRCSWDGGGESWEAGRELEQEKQIGQQGGGGLGWGPPDWEKHLAAPQVRHYYFCKLGQQISSQILESALCVGTVKHRV